jgi:F420-dependent oxidoreductase-like protein
MRLALMIEGQEGVTWDDWVAIAEACEEAGVETLVRSDHYLSWTDDSRPALDAWATIAALAALTSRLRFGTLVSPATFRHPAVLARMAATADHVSGGRVEVGIGAGWLAREHEAYGFEFFTAQERVERLGEQVEIVRRLLTEERVSFAGAHYELDDAPGIRGVQRPGPPLVVGGSAKRGTTTPAVRFADEYNVVFAPADELRERRLRLDAACASVGRDPATLRYSVMTPLLVGGDDGEVRESAVRIAAKTEREPDEVRAHYAQVGAAGTVDEVVERLRALEGLGYERAMLQHLVHDDLETVRLIGRELAPALA